MICYKIARLFLIINLGDFMSSLEKTFELSKRGSTVRQEIIAGLTTFLAMVYSVIVVPKMLGDAGFPAESVFIATC